MIQNDDRPQEFKMRKLDLDFFFQVTLLGFFSLLIWESRSYPLESKFYPRIISVIALILLLISMARHFREKEETKVENPEYALRRRRFVEITLVIIVATLLGFIGGFLLSILCYYVGYALFQRGRISLVRALAIGVTLTVLFYLSFGWFMNVPLLRGWLLSF